MVEEKTWFLTRSEFLTLNTLPSPSDRAPPTRVMAGGGRSSARSRARPSSSLSPADSDADPLLRAARPGQRPRRGTSGDHGPIRLMDASLKTLLLLGLGFVVAMLFASAFYYYHWASGGGGELRRVVTPLAAPKMMDLPQFRGEHRESLYWGTYRPHIYLGIRARTPRSLIAGLMWIGVKDGQYVLRHVCQDSDDLKTYGWIDHNGRDYGRQVLVDHGLKLTTNFLKAKVDGSGYGGDWTVRVEADNERSNLDEVERMTTHLFFYIADEEGNSLNIAREEFAFDDKMLLAFGSRKDVGGWELHLSSKDNLETHYAGFKTLHMHNLTELLLGALSAHARTSGRLQLPDAYDHSPNIFFFQISANLPCKMDIAFVSGTSSKGSKVKERIESLTGTILSGQLLEKQKDFEEKYTRIFNLAEKVDSDSSLVGKAAIANLLGGIGYFYGQSKIALPSGLILENGNKFIPYWPSALFTAVPSRSFFPRGFLWDEGFHQLLIWRWDIGICLDIIGHWLDLINVDGWIPREQILGAEALSKVPAEYVLQHPTNGNPPTLFLVIHDLVRGIKGNKFSVRETKEISSFLNRAFIRLEAWFQWFNTTQSGKDLYTYYWHGRDNMTTRELNPKTLTSGLDDYPRASHPSDQERHVDLRCWMLLAADCMHSIAELLELNDGMVYQKMVQQLSNFDILNQMHLDNVSGAYFDFGNHTEKVRLRWYQVKDGDSLTRELLREVLESPRLQLVPHIGYVSLFPFMMGIIPPASQILEKQLELISNHTTLWTDYGLRSLAKTSSLYMKRNTEHDAPYWRGPIWINMNYMILSALHHYSQEDGPYKFKAKSIYEELRKNLIRNIVSNYHDNGFLWEQYDPKNKGKGKGARPFTGWTALVLLIMAEAYPDL